MLYQTELAKRRGGSPRALSAGVVMFAAFTADLSAGIVAASDKIELGALPAGAKIIRARSYGNLGALTADIGLMSGAPGDNDDTRTVGSQIFNDVSVNGNEGTATLPSLDAIAIDPDAHRGIGATLSGNLAAAAGKYLTLWIEYVY